MPKALIETKKRKRKPITATAKTLAHPEGREATAGHEERLAAFIKRTLQLKREGWYLHEIAEKIADEYKLEVVPHITTVSGWNKQGMGAVSEDILTLQNEIRINQFNDLERLKRKWMPLATADSIAITRWKMIEGEVQPDLDENAVKEQIEATKQVVNIMARQAKLLGLDLTQSTNKDGDGPGTVQDLQLWMIGQINVSAHGAAIDIPGEVLELRTGIPEIDQTDSV